MVRRQRRGVVGGVEVLQRRKPKVGIKEMLTSSNDLARKHTLLKASFTNVAQKVKQPVFDVFYDSKL